MKSSTIKVLSIGGQALGLVGTIVSSFASDKKMDATISEKVAEKIAESKEN